MNVRLNEAALKVLLDTQEGPVGMFVARTAGRVVEQAQGNVNAYFASAPTLDVGQDVQFDMEGSTATIGLRPPPDKSGDKAKRMAAKQADGSFPWLTRALEATRT